MTAQEMFESMGFKKEKFDYFGLDRFVYKKPIVDEGDYLYTFVVLFDKEEKTTSVYCDEYSEDYEYGYDAPPAIDMELLKAISQQCRELGVAIMDDALFEIDNMCHALGFDPNGIRKGQKVYEYYRNFFVASGEYKDSWEKLVKWGDAAKASNAIVGSYYYVTQKGIDFLSSIYKIKLQPRK